MQDAAAVGDEYGLDAVALHVDRGQQTLEHAILRADAKRVQQIVEGQVDLATAQVWREVRLCGERSDAVLSIADAEANDIGRRGRDQHAAVA